MCACVMIASACGDDAAAPADDDAGNGGGGAGAGGAGTLAGSAGSGGRSGASGSQASGGGGNGSDDAGEGGGAGDAGNGASAGQGGGAGGANAVGDLPAIAGCTLFTADDAWNQDVSDASVDADATARLMALVGDTEIHPDYGNSGDEHYGIPINVVPEDQPLLEVAIDWYPEESDPGPYPFPAPEDTRVEGGSPEACDGDCHVLVVQQGSCMLYEGYACGFSDQWHCGGEATWDLSANSYGQRPDGWTSADAAGLAITPGLLRFDEVEAGEVRHAIRFTVHCTRAEYIPPASHQAVPGGCDDDDPNAPPMGLRVRLRADYDLSALSAESQVIARAMQRYGMILADNGSDFYFQGEQHLGWTDAHVEPLKDIPASAFEVVTP
jgi:hypothetical protein